MKNFTFKGPKIYREIFKPGSLTALTEEILNGAERKSYTGLTLDELAQVPSLYGAFNPREVNVLELEDEKVYKTPNGKEVFGSDIKSLTELMYRKPRTTYVEFGRVKQIHESMHSGAVPLPMLGFKRHFNIPYSKWMGTIEDFELDKKTFEIKAKAGGLERAFKLDLMLGQTFASTIFNQVTGDIEWNDKDYGLVILSTLRGKGYYPSAIEMEYLRTAGMGNYKGSYASQYGTASITIKKPYDSDIIKMYNKASTPMRLLMAQRWCWYGNHRMSDMIMDLQDWDRIPPKHDTVANVFVGLKPSGDRSVFGIGVKS